MSTSPILGFICPTCRHGMRPVCDACEEREQIKAGEQASAEQSAQQQAFHMRLAEWRAIPGYQALEDDLEAHLYSLATVVVEADADEDGPTVPTPPASYEEANAAAQARLDAADLLDRETLLAQWREAEQVLDRETDEGAS